MEEKRTDREKFLRTVLKRLQQGEQEYGNSSFSRPISCILSEIEEELLDIAGWGYIGWCKIQKLKQKVENSIEDEPAETAPDVGPATSVFSDGTVVYRKQMK